MIRSRTYFLFFRISVVKQLKMAIPHYTLDFEGIMVYNSIQNSTQEQEVRYELIRDASPRGGAGTADFCFARWLCHKENRQW